MSVIGRLWRRAPLWRGCLVTALAMTALAALFPPAVTLPSGLFSAWRGGHPAAGTPAAASFTPTADTGRDYDTMFDPPLGTGRSGVIPVGGRSMPLPAGSWQPILLAQSGEASGLQVTLLSRIVEARLTGLLMVITPSELGQTPGPVQTPPGCLNPDTLVREIAPSLQGENPMVHRCWTLSAVDMTGASMMGNRLLQRGLSRLAPLKVQVPDHMLEAVFVNTDENGGMVTTLLVPDKPADPALRRRVEAWARQFDASVAAGFSGRLKGEPPASVIRDPS